MLYRATLGPFEDLYRGLCLKAAALHTTLLYFRISCTLMRMTLDFIEVRADKNASLRQKGKT